MIKFKKVSVDIRELIRNGNSIGELRNDHSYGWVLTLNDCYTELTFADVQEIHHYMLGLGSKT